MGAHRPPCSDCRTPETSPAAACAHEARGAHQACDPLAAMLLPSCPQLGMNTGRSVCLVRAGTDGPDPLEQRRIGQGMGERRTLEPSVVAGLGHAQHAGHGGDGEHGLVCAHEPEEPDATTPVSREPGSRSRKDVALHPQLPVLAPQPGQLVALGRAQAITCRGRSVAPFPAALLAASGSNPLADRLRGWLELLGQADGIAPGTGQGQ